MARTGYGSKVEGPAPSFPCGRSGTSSRLSYSCSPEHGSLLPTSRVGSAYFKGSGTSFSTAITSGAAALLLEREPGLTPDQIKARLLGTAGTGPAGDANIDGQGSLDAYAAAHAGTYDSANEGVSRSLGTDSINLDRGSLQVQIHLGLIPDLLGLLLQPVQLLFGTNLTAQNQLFDSLDFLTSEGTGSRWYESQWGGNRWYGSRWYGSRWYGSRWYGIAWDRNSSLPLRLRNLIGAVAAAGLATLALAWAVGGDAGVGPVAEWVAFAVVIALSWSFPLLVLRREETETFSLDEAFLVAAAMLLTPFGTILTFGVAAIVSHAVRRRPFSRLAFNFGMVLCASGAAVGVINLVGGDRGVRPLDMGAVVLGAAVFLVVNSILVSAVLAAADDQPFWRTLTDGAGFRLLQWTATVAVGLLGGLAGSAYSWALLLTLVPMAAVQGVLSGSLRARRDHERVDGLLRAALESHASVQPADVEEAITASARELLDCRQARLSETPSGEGELGSRVPGQRYPECFLVVSERRGHEAFTAHDAKLLDALVAVGSVAIHNAELVEQLKHEAFHDALTGLPNQLLFEETVSLALAERRQPERRLAVLVLDVDRFKRVNDSLGHTAGNELLCEVARRLTGAVRGGDTVARMSGDEFTLLVTGLRSTGEAALVAEKVMAVFQTPFMVSGQELYVTASLGIAVSLDDGNRPSVLLKNADIAMYRAKEQGRNCFEIYSADMNAGVEARLALEGDLHQAIDSGQLRVVYQPQIDLLTGRVTGVEALTRWDHPTLGPIAPDTFIPLAEESGLIVALDDWVMRTACAQVRAWRDAGLPPLRMAVNLSGRAFWRARIVERVTEVLAITGVDPEQLELEVTESMAVDAVADTRSLFRELEALGVRLAIDDFGTGYSALGRLQGLPFHTLKIDRSFVVGVENPHDEAPIVAAVIAMAHALKLKVVAEGVETEAQHSFLARNGCDMAQGYLFGRPVEPAEIEAMFRPESALATSR